MSHHFADPAAGNLDARTRDGPFRPSREALVAIGLGGLAAAVAAVAFTGGLVLAPHSRGVTIATGLGVVVAAALLASLGAVIVQRRFARAAVGVQLVAPTQSKGLRGALRRLLGDPSLDLARYRPERGSYVDREGVAVVLPRAQERRVATPVFHAGEPVGALIHDREKPLAPDVLEAVSATVGFVFANEQALEAAQRIELRTRALIDAIPDPMMRVARDGTLLDIQADDQAGLVRPAEEMVGRNVRELLPVDVVEKVLACIERTLASGRMNAVEYEIEIGGIPRWKESRMVPSGGGEVVTIVRDFTEPRQAEAELRRLAEEQAALRRVATLVAGDAPPAQVFQTVTEEVSRVLGLRTAVLHRFEDANTSRIVGKFGDPTGTYETGNVIRLETGSALSVARTGAPARSNYNELTGPGATELRALGFRSSVGVPISVAGITWGALVAAFREGETLPLEAERRLAGFAELVALAVASAHTRAQLAASRLRIVEAGDAERRRIERNLHDGAQQRLVALSLQLRLAQKKARTAPREAGELIAAAGKEVAEALAELRELAQGIHPAVLTDRGLVTALEVLVARSPLRVRLQVELPERLPPPIEAAAYYVVSESLANTAKHAEATVAKVRVEWRDRNARVTVKDNGLGGADIDRGSGLCGLRDRVEALAGTLTIDSPPSHGTVVLAEIPVD